MAEKQRWKPVCFALRFPADYWPASGRTGSYRSRRAQAQRACDYVLGAKWD